MKPDNTWLKVIKTYLKKNEGGVINHRSAAESMNGARGVAVSVDSAPFWTQHLLAVQDEHL